jgi:acyl-CoA thioesterase-1
MTLPVNIDSTYADSGTDSTIALHQKHHDTIHAAVNGLPYSYASIHTGRPGNLFVFLGDSTTSGSDDPVNNVRSESWPTYASVMSQQVVRFVRNAGISGDTTAGVLARFDTDVTPYSPTAVTILVGTNDVENTDFITWQGLVKQIVAKVRGIAAVPVLCTILPYSGAGAVNRAQETGRWNQWLREYASRQGIMLLDFYYVLSDPVTGAMKSAYVGDGTHPSFAGLAAMGSYASSILSPRMAPNQPTLCQSNVDENSALYQGTFASNTGTTIPTGWVDNAGVPTGSTVSYVTDAQVDGQLFTITHSAASSARQVVYPMALGAATFTTAAVAGATTINLSANPYTRATLFLGSGANAEIVKVASVTGSGPYAATLTRATRYAHALNESLIINGTTGDTLLYSGIVTKTGTGAGATAGLVFPTLGYALQNVTQPITRGMFMMTATIPAATASVQASMQAEAGTGTVGFGQVGVYNITRLGWANP